MPVYKSVEIGNAMVKTGEILYPAATDASLHQVVLGSEICSLLFYSEKGDVICLKYEHRKIAILVYCPDSKDIKEFEQHYSATDEMKNELVIVDMAKVTNVVFSVIGSFVLHPMQNVSLPIMRGGRFNTLHTMFGNTVRFTDINACALVTWEVSPKRQKYFSPEKVLHQLAEFHLTYSRITGHYTAHLGHQAYVMVLQTQGARTNLHFVQTKYRYDRRSFCCMYQEIVLTPHVLSMVNGSLGETKDIRKKSFRVPWHLLHPCIHYDTFFIGLHHPNYYAVCHQILTRSCHEQATFSKILIPAGIYTNFAMSSTTRRKAKALREVTLIGVPSHVIPEPLQSTPPLDPLLSQATKEDNKILDVEHSSDSDTDFAITPIPLEIDYADC